MCCWKCNKFLLQLKVYEEKMWNETNVSILAVHNGPLFLLKLCCRRGCRFLFTYCIIRTNIALCRPVIESIHNVTTFCCCCCVKPNVWHAACRTPYTYNDCSLCLLCECEFTRFIYLFLLLCFFFIHFRNYLIEILLFWFSFHFATLLTATAMATVYVCRTSVSECMWINWFLLAQFL